MPTVPRGNTNAPVIAARRARRGPDQGRDAAERRSRRVGGQRLGREQGQVPALAVAGEQPPLVDAVVGFAPELDDLRDDPSAPQSSGSPAPSPGPAARCASRSRSRRGPRSARPAERRRSAVGGRGRARRRAPRPGRDRRCSALPITWTCRPSEGQWKSSATLGFASTSRALRVQSAVVKSRASSSSRFKVTVRAEGRPRPRRSRRRPSRGGGGPARGPPRSTRASSCSGWASVSGTPVKEITVAGGGPGLDSPRDVARRLLRLSAGRCVQRLHGAAAPQPHPRQGLLGWRHPGLLREHGRGRRGRGGGRRSSTARAAQARRCGPWSRAARFAT